MPTTTTSSGACGGGIEEHDIRDGGRSNESEGRLVIDELSQEIVASDIRLGCDVSGSTATTARVRNAAAQGYFLLVAAGDGGCEGPYGERSDGRDRHDSEVDPRPDEGFCP